MKQEINLEEVLNKYSIYLSPYVKEHLQLKAAIKELIYKALDLAAENIKSQALEDFGSECPDCWSENSILQIKNWIK